MPTPTTELLLTSEVAELLRAPESTVRYWRHIGSGPPSVKVGRRVLYRRDALEAWIRERERTTAQMLLPRSRRDSSPMG